QRGCWKLFHDTPTTQPPAAAEAPALAAALVAALGAAVEATVLGAALDPPLLHAASKNTATVATAANRRSNM
ncbi:MAG: hypothetical protein ABJC39_00860, partial [Chloroflexota bacterium]